MLFIRSITTLLTLSVMTFAIFGVVRAQGDAPAISGVEVEQVEETSLTITWETDEEADSLINYGLQPDYGIVRIPGADRTEHSVTLEELEPGRIYYFRVVSADEEGNQGISADYQVRMSGEPQTGEADGQGQSSQTTTESPTVEEITEQVEQIEDPESLQEILDTVVQAIQGVTDDLTIVGPPTVEVGTTRATISWTTDRPASSEVQFSPTESYNGGNFQFSQSSTGPNTQEHEIELIGLEPFTEYSYRVRSTDELSITGSSEVFTFQTKATRPEIRNLRIVKVEENSATLAWDTTAPAQALVEYQNLSTGEQNSVGRPTLASSHQMRLADLTLGTRYVAFVISENSSGDRVRSRPIEFITVRDTAPPIISNVTNESTIFPGGESRIQTIIEWETDEPSSCTMTYQEGVAGGTDEVVLEPELIEYNTTHVEVITDFAPATAYQFWLDCVDDADNVARSEDFVLFTPIQEKSIIDLIIENFESTFGWVQNITN